MRSVFRWRKRVSILIPLRTLFRNTTVEMSDFSSTVNRLSPDLDMLGIGLDDAAAILEAFGSKGCSGLCGHERVPNGNLSGGNG